MEKLLFLGLFIGAIWNVAMPIAAIIYSCLNPLYVVLLNNCYFFLGVSFLCIILFGVLAFVGRKG